MHADHCIVDLDAKGRIEKIALWLDREEYEATRGTNPRAYNDASDKTRTPFWAKTARHGTPAIIIFTDQPPRLRPPACGR